MRVVCSYCRELIRTIPGETGLSHGMCAACDEHFGRLWGGITLDEYLDALPQPILVVDDDVRVAVMNRAAEALMGRSRREARGLLGGDALACKNSRLPEGCGQTVHCRECAIRRTVERVARTRRAEHAVPAYVKTEKGRLDVAITVEPDGALFRVTVLEAPAEPVRL